jgi:uncharacterized membrane protein YphA (DoxX/SURF4 family)
MNSSRWLTVIRYTLGVIFITYGTVKLLGGQYYYGDWVMNKKTVDGTSLVWAFYGYSPVYGRFTGLFELVPGILLLRRRTATIGAAALFAVALNITVMDFAYGYPAVKYFVLLYTVLLAVLLWADRDKLRLLLEDTSRARAVLAALPPEQTAPRAPLGSTARRLAIAVIAVAALSIANLLAIVLGGGPEASARKALVEEGLAGDHVELLRSRQTGLIGLDWKATVDFRVTQQGTTDTVTVEARRRTGFLPWRVERARRSGH